MSRELMEPGKSRMPVRVSLWFFQEHFFGVHSVTSVSMCRKKCFKFCFSIPTELPNSLHSDFFSKKTMRTIMFLCKIFFFTKYSKNESEYFYFLSNSWNLFFYFFFCQKPNHNIIWNKLLFYWKWFYFLFQPRKSIF